MPPFYGIVGVSEIGYPYDRCRSQHQTGRSNDPPGQNGEPSTPEGYDFPPSIAGDAEYGMILTLKMRKGSRDEDVKSAHPEHRQEIRPNSLHSMERPTRFLTIPE